MKKFASITKVDHALRMVYGYASTEALDSQGEVVKLDAINAALEGYMKFANIREMHQPSAVGVAKEANVDEVGLYLAVKVVDDAAWEKVVEGVYKGFSIGGRVTQRDTVNKAIITGMTLTEISLVDRPANPEATFDVFKADSPDEQEDPQPTVDVPAVAETVATVTDPAAEEPPQLEMSAEDQAKADTITLGAVDTIAAMLDKGDITPERMVELAVLDITKSDEYAIDIKLSGALSKGEITSERVIELATADMNIAKGMGGVGWLASLLKNIKYLVEDQQYETDREADGSLMPDRLRGWLLSGAELLQLMTAEEVAELVGGGDATGMGDGVIELADTDTDIEKAGKRNSKADQTKIQTMHDHCCALGAECSNDASSSSNKGEGIGGTGDFAKLQADLIDEAANKVLKGLGIVEGVLFAEAINKMAGRITELEAMPTVGKAFLRAVAKGEDLTSLHDAEKVAKAEAEALELEKSMTPEQRAHAQLSKMFAQQGRTS